VSHPTQDHVELAFLANIGAWGKVSSWAFGRAWPGVGSAVLAMIAAQRAGSIEALGPGVRRIVRVLTWPGSVAVHEVMASARTYQSHTFEPQVGDKIRNVNPKCKHRGSEGTVTAVLSLPGGKGKTVRYRSENSGEHWTTGDVLEKTLDQLAPQQAARVSEPCCHGCATGGACEGDLCPD